MTLAAVAASACCCEGSDCDCATTAFTVDWTGDITLECVCNEDPLPDGCGPYAYTGSLVITGATIVCTQRASCSYTGSASFDATATSCVEESDEPDRTVTVVLQAAVYKLPPGAGGEWRVSIKAYRYVDGTLLAYGGFGSGQLAFAEWLYAPECRPLDGDCPCDGDYAVTAGGFNTPSGTDEPGNNYGCGGYMRMASVDAGSVTLS